MRLLLRFGLEHLVMPSAEWLIQRTKDGQEWDWDWTCAEFLHGK